MNRLAHMSLQSGLLILLFLCIADCLFLPDSDSIRHKRGFRKNVADRMAHNFGKRDYRSSSSVENLYNDDSNLPTDHLSESIRKLIKYMSGEFQSSLIVSTQEFTKLLQENEELADLIVKKFIDINDDDIISSDELFRRVRE